MDYKYRRIGFMFFYVEVKRETGGGEAGWQNECEDNDRSANRFES